MKRLYVAFVLIAFSFGICFISSIKVGKEAKIMQEQLNIIATEIKNRNKSSLAKLIDEAENKWDKTETLYSFIVDADKIEEMNISFAMIKAHLKDGNTEHALERLHECKLMLREISENEKLNIKNIM